jgi:peptidoglycan/LPS O-acetylase OafA/YrhL
LTVATSAVAGPARAPAPPAPAGDSRRVANVDVLRAFAALGVLAIHAYALGGRNPPIRAQHAYDVPLLTLATGVWLFFAVSGYVIGRPFVDRLLADRPLPGLGAYASRRAARIYPLYWIALTAVIAVAGSAGASGWQYPLHYLLLNNLVPGRQEALFPAAWTLTLEALFYAVLPLLVVAVRLRWRRPSPERLAALIIASWVLSVAFTAVADLQGDTEVGLWLRGSLPAMWQMFCPGLLLAVVGHLRRGRLRHWLIELPAGGRALPVLAVAVAVLIPAAVLGAAAPLRYGIVDYQLLTDASRPLFAIGYGLLLAAAIAATPSRSRVAITLGAASYGIYLLHAVIASALEHLGWAPVPHDTLAGFIVNTAVLAALTIPLALASWRWLEQPAMRLAAGH